MSNAYAFIGNNLSLDFVNTVGYIASENPTEKLNSCSDLIEWGKQGRLLSNDEAERLLAETKKNLSESEKVFQRVLRLRKSIYDIFKSVAKGEQASGKDLAVLNNELSRAMSDAELYRRDDEWVWDWKDNSLERILFRIARDAAQLLTSPDLEKLKCCFGETCGWLFYDTSKNNRRQWCDMRDCGNLAKAKRFRSKKAIKN